MTTAAAIAVILTAGSAVSALSKPQGHNLMKLPSFRGVAEVRSSLPGRFRAYIPKVTEDPKAAIEMRDKLVSTGTVHAVYINIRTGSALFIYDETAVEGAVVFGAAIRLLGLDEDIRKPSISGLEQGLGSIYSAVNFGLMEATNGLLDCKTAAGSALTIAAVRNMLLGKGIGMPGTLTLLWWASNLFRRNAL